MKYATQSEGTCGGVIVDSEYNNGFKFKIETTTVNIIPLLGVEYFAWKSATETLKSWASHDNYVRKALSQRNMRIGLTESLRATYKSALAMGSVL